MPENQARDLPGTIFWPAKAFVGCRLGGLRLWSIALWAYLAGLKVWEHAPRLKLLPLYHPLPAQTNILGRLPPPILYIFQKFFSPLPMFKIRANNLSP